MIFEIENWLWKSNLGTFWHLPLHQFAKFNSFFWVCWFLVQNLPYFISFPWILHNRNCIYEGFAISQNKIIAYAHTVIISSQCTDQPDVSGRKKKTSWKQPMDLSSASIFSFSFLWTRLHYLINIPVNRALW